MTLLQLPNKNQRANNPLLISLYIPRAYRHALIAPCFHSVRFSTSPPYRGQLCALPHTCLCRYLIGFLTKSKSESVLISAIGLVAF
ncbi:hypothetical protein ACN38_g3672 [Penicillium nordicum]|uniref:Uncharacterized protein n=1 Tax=Penicillium nordicum TaxID=229535 RepID=A0A0M9WHT0_9EURO|nr:hypothetical protein ACN38_g3672 [Penicillium nordicum]